VDGPQRMLEFQALTQAHGIDKEIIMICKHTSDCSTTVTGSKLIYLPFFGNIALVQALVATTKAATPSLEGLQPKKIQAEQKPIDEGTTLRICIDMRGFGFAKMMSCRWELAKCRQGCHSQKQDAGRGVQLSIFG